jgi:MFS transporter, DHA2 family, multidrug resistance protein
MSARGAEYATAADLREVWRPRVNPWIVTMTVMLTTFMEVLDGTIANVALPHIASGLAVSVDESTWILTSYLVSNAIVLPLSGWFASLFGRKRFYMACVVLFTVGSLLCGVATSIGWLVFFRILQGVGGGALQPTSQAILVESHPRRNQGMAMAAYGMGVVVAPIVGPTLGGWITDNYSWRWIFFINIPIGAVALLMTSALVDDPPYFIRKSLRALHIDYIGIGLLAVGLGALQVFLDKGEREDWFASSFITVFAVLAVVCLAVVIFWEFHHHDPVIDIHLLRDRNFILANVLMFTLGFVLYASTMLVPVFLQTLLGYTAYMSGLVLTPGAILILILLPVAGMLLPRVGPRWLVAAGLLSGGLSLIFLLAPLSLAADFRTITMARALQTAGMAFLFVPINAAAFINIPREKMSNATGIINLARNIGGSAGVSFVTTMLARRAQFHQSVLVSHVTPYSYDFQAFVQGAGQAFVGRGGSDPQQAADQAGGLSYLLVQQQAGMLSFIDNFWLLGVIFLALIPLALALKKPGHGEQPRLTE